MADNVDGYEILTADQGIGYLADGVAMRIQHHHLGGLAPGDRHAVGQFSADKNNFATAGLIVEKKTIGGGIGGNRHNRAKRHACGHHYA